MPESIALLVVLALAALLVLAKALSQLGKPGAKRSQDDGGIAAGARRDRDDDHDGSDGGGDGD